MGYRLNGNGVLIVWSFWTKVITKVNKVEELIFRCKFLIINNKQDWFSTHSILSKQLPYRRMLFESGWTDSIFLVNVLSSWIFVDTDEVCSVQNHNIGQYFGPWYYLTLALNINLHDKTQNQVKNRTNINYIHMKNITLAYFVLVHNC